MRLALVIAALVCVAGPALAQSNNDATLNELQAAAKPAQQKDLDTFKLASAHRERAESMREKTNGLWQPWLVSICEGCGPERQPYSTRPWSLVSEKAAPNAVAVQKPTTEAPKAAAVKPQKSRGATSLLANLSDRDVHQIRRMPRQ